MSDELRDAFERRMMRVHESHEQAIDLLNALSRHIDRGVHTYRFTNSDDWVLVIDQDAAARLVEELES